MLRIAPFNSIDDLLSWELEPEYRSLSVPVECMFPPKQMPHSSCQKSLSQEALDALAEIGTPSGHQVAITEFTRIWNEEGEDFFWGFINDVRAQHAIALNWFPRLREYAAACRARSPAPVISSLTDDQYEELRLIREGLRQRVNVEGPIRGKPTRPAVVTTTTIGLLAVPPLIPIGSEHVVLLLNDEFEQWEETVYDDEPCDPWWYTRWSTKVVKSPDEDWLRMRIDPADTDRLRDLQESGQIWVVSVSGGIGALASSGTDRIFVWDGETARPTALGGCWNS